MKNKIYVTQPFLPELEEYIPYLEKIWKSKWLTNNGQFHQLLETELADYLGVKYISLFANGTLALITALQALNITGEVITTPYSFVATSNALWWNNAKPVFVDIESKTFNLDPEKIEAAITPQTTAILPVHVYGNPCNVDAIKKIADKYDLKVIYDAAHAFGVKFNQNSILNFGDLSILSFHATKVYNTFEGGAIVSHDAETKSHIDDLKNFGFRGETKIMVPGMNAKMNELQASMGLLQLKHIEEIIKKREEITDFYRQKLRNIFGISFLDDMKEVNHNYSYFPIFVNGAKYGKSRDELYNYLIENNIYCRRYFYPLISQFSVYSNLNSACSKNLYVAAKITKQVICLPIYPDLKKHDMKRIISLIAKE